MTEETPVYSDLEVVHETGRKSFQDAPETGGVDNFKRDFSAAARSRERGAFGRRTSKSEETPEQEPIDYDHINATIAENLQLRQRVEEAELNAEWANEERLDQLAYSEHESSDDYALAADELLESRESDRLWGLVSNWNEVDPAGAQQWVESREQAATIAAGHAGAQAMQTAQQAVTSAFAEELASFYKAHPEYQTGTTQNAMLAQALASNPNIGDSPQSFRAGLEAAREVAESVQAGALRTANLMSFKEQFAEEAGRSFHRPAADHLAEVAARRATGPSPEQLAAEFAARATGTKSQRQAALQARDAEFADAFAQAAKGSGFGSGAREQAARAEEAREQERLGLIPPNRGI